MDKEPMTSQGYQNLTDELADLKNNQRGIVAKEIQAARELGDLKENAEYHAAKEKQSLLEAKIAQLELIAQKAQVIDPKGLPHARVSFGSTVLLLDLDSEKEEKYTIVGLLEANLSKGYISYHSPLAKALLGKASGDQFVANLPGGAKEFEILEVRYEEIKL
ncbi:MAG: transcription elongation factor GreA [Helicobacteraceae bacterium]